jgi:hypothetical protein
MAFESQTKPAWRERQGGPAHDLGPAGSRDDDLEHVDPFDNPNVNVICPY